MLNQKIIDSKREQLIAKKPLEDLTVSDINNWAKRRVKRAYLSGRINHAEKRRMLDAINAERYNEIVSDKAFKKAF